MAGIKKIINIEKLSAKLLFTATLFALLLSNSPLKNYYIILFNNNFFNLTLFINDGLMTLFFLLVGLEIKYELLQGSLNSVRKAALPAIGALGGMIVPACIYVAMTYSHPNTLKGWAVPTATDIAFSLAILSLVGSRIHSSLKVFLTALAIFDDLGAISIIAIFYTEQLTVLYLVCAAILIFILCLINKLGVRTLRLYCIIGFGLWLALLKSGVHPTLAGVILAATIPLKNSNQSHLAPLHKLQQKLHPWVAIIILPLFALANAGVALLAHDFKTFNYNIILGVLCGLFIGKQIGIFSFAWLATKMHLAILPKDIRMRELYAVSILCGVGFTISLFIGALAFTNHASYLNSVKIGVLTGSALSGITGYLLLLTLNKKK
jgi:NhaA family Na+:H+ antiporter